MIEQLREQIQALEALRDRPALVYHAMIQDDAVRVLYECLRAAGQMRRLDLVLCTTGGVVTAARRIALLLREYVEQLTILVPQRARSSGTLLCLSADELVLGPLAELSPIDPRIGSAGAPPAESPGMIGAEDVRAFRRMAEDWFGVTREEDRLQVLALVAQRFFPTSLSAFYRSDRLVRRVAGELLAFQLPDADAAERERIVERLVSGYDAHDETITRADVRAIGLRARAATAQEETLLWRIAETCRAQIADAPHDAPDVRGLIAGRICVAREVHRWQAGPQGRISDTRWERVEWGSV